VRIRFREDSPLKADDAARLGRDHKTLWFEPSELKGVDGDCWWVGWYTPDGSNRRAGYAICCPKCAQVHHWTTALNCGQKVVRNGVEVCVHSGVSSCWTWTGSARRGTLTAQPSLHSIDEGKAHLDEGYGCGWHGWLTNGELTPDV
jgi:hypothetical protein